MVLGIGVDKLRGHDLDFLLGLQRVARIPPHNDGVGDLVHGVGVEQRELAQVVDKRQPAAGRGREIGGPQQGQSIAA